MPYLGRGSDFGVRSVFHFLATNGQTSVSGSDADGKALNFTDGNFIDVYLNGVRLKLGEDYNTGTANTIAGLSALDANDEVNVVVYDTFTVADTVRASEGGTFSGALSVTGDVTSTGTVNVTGDTSSGDDASIGFTSAEGLILTGQGTTSDVTVKNDADTAVIQIPTGTDDVNFTDDISLKSDSSVLKFGNDEEITITHVADTGLNFKHTATGDDKPIVLTLQTGETDIAASDVLGAINFQAPDEGTGTDAILVSAGIEAVSEGDFSSTSNATSLTFKTGSSEAAAEKVRIDSSGNIGINNTSPTTMIDIVAPSTARSAIRGASSTADDTSKAFGMLCRNYDSDEEDFVVIQAVSGSGTNVVDIGGGDLLGTHNACSSFRIFTAANKTTTGGTTRLSINGSGLIANYLSSSDNNYVMNVNSQGTAGATGLYNLYFKADSAVFTGYHYYAKKEPTILYTEEDTIPSGKKVGDVKTQGETFEMGDVIVYENGKVTKCTKAHATNVVGIYSGHPMPGGRWLSNNKDDIATEEHALEVASVGDSQDWNKTVTHYLTGFKVCNENGAISSGDLLCTASKTGYLMKQDGTAITSETVGKSMDTVSFDSDGNATGIYGFLYCG